MRLADLGGDVAVICPFPRHPALQTRAVQRVFRYRASHPLSSLKNAIEAIDPDIILPLCDRSVEHLHKLHRRLTIDGAVSKISRLIEYSLGPSESFDIVSSRYQLLEVARSEGIRTPDMIPVTSQADLDLWCAQSAPPWVIKSEGSWGGLGVRIARDVREANHSCLDLSQRPTLVELIKRLSLNRGRQWIVSEWARDKPRIIAQSYVRGRPANCAVACWRGELLAGTAVEVIQAQGPTEPARVVQIVDGSEMLWAAEKLARRFHLSGFFGLDFMIEEGTGRAYLIEMNPRCTPPCPIPLGPGRDLVTALWGQITGRQIKERKAITDKLQIAYFPRKWGVPGGGEEAPPAEAYYDIPEGEPALIQELLHPWSSRTWLGQMIDLARRISPSRKASADCVFEEAAAPVAPEARSAVRR
jgi:hypothetical protein